MGMRGMFDSCPAFRGLIRSMSISVQEALRLILKQRPRDEPAKILAVRIGFALALDLNPKSVIQFTASLFDPRLTNCK